MESLTTAVYLWLLILSLAGFGGAQKMVTFSRELLHLRLALIANPYLFWQRHCEQSPAGLVAGGRRVLLPFSVECGHQVLWRQGGQWRPLCPKPGGNDQGHGRKSRPLFSARYYRIQAQCHLRSGNHLYPLAHGRWQIFA